jgi:hypothetical protein
VTLQPAVDHFQRAGRILLKHVPADAELREALVVGETFERGRDKLLDAIVGPVLICPFRRRPGARIKSKIPI